MSIFKLVLRSLCFYRRTNVGVLLAVVLGAAVLAGALAVGDSVRYSLLKSVELRLGKTKFALFSRQRFFTEKLAEEVGGRMDSQTAGVLDVRGMISTGDGSRRANRVDVLGVDDNFYRLAGAGSPFGAGSECVVINKPLADKLRVRAGDEVVVRIARPGVMSRNIALTPQTGLSTAFRLRVECIAGESGFGRFGLQANQLAAMNVFVPLGWLQSKLSRSGRVNMLLAADRMGKELTLAEANEALESCWRLADAGIEFRRVRHGRWLELRSEAVFIAEPAAEAAVKAGKGVVGILTYFVNGLRVGKRTAPYSMVAAMSKSQDRSASINPEDMNDDEIIVNEWLANDLDARPGDTVELSYFIAGPGDILNERSRRFHIRRIVPIEGPAADVNLMPEFPGLAKVDNCRDWEPGIAIDLDKIRPKDQAYWDSYRGTPKAFVTLEAGRSMWKNRYGGLTAVRYPAGGDEKRIAENIRRAIRPESMGLFFEPVRRRQLEASSQATDFGQLFLGFSFFLIASAVVLMGLIFVFGVESRAQQIGMLMAIGFRRRTVREILLLEGLCLAVVGAVVGTAAGLFYTRAMIFGLATIWRTAVSGRAILFHVEGRTLLIAAGTAVVISFAAIWLSVRGQVRRGVHELLAGDVAGQYFGAGRASMPRASLAVSTAALIGAAGLAVFMLTGGGRGQAGAFFGVGSLLLIAGLGLGHYNLATMAVGISELAGTVAGLSLRNVTKRRGRSLAVVWMLACGIFLVIAIGANRKNPLANAGRRDSGTGGFALYGESAIGVLRDLNSDDGHRALGLDGNELAGVDVVRLKVHDGDDASCFNLNRAQKPRLLGVRPEQLEVRSAFSFVKVTKGRRVEDGWKLLDEDFGVDVVPAIGDSATVTWALGKGVGDDIEFTDEQGRSFKIRIVALLNDSILQGAVVISQSAFEEHFPGEEGYRVFLIDAPAGKRQLAPEGRVADLLSNRLSNYGMDVTPAVRRLAEFTAVENTYLSIFQMLGGLGLILGSIGLGVVVLRNVLDRRGELAMLWAVGFDKRSLKRMVLYEHSGLMIGGLAVGLVAALAAVGPVLISGAGDVPYLSLIATAGAILLSGIVWIWLAVVIALAGDILQALRNE